MLFVHYAICHFTFIFQHHFVLLMSLFLFEISIPKQISNNYYKRMPPPKLNKKTKILSKIFEILKYKGINEKYTNPLIQSTNQYFTFNLHLEQK